MSLVVSILVGIVAAFHVYVMWLEMFAWTTRGPKVFSQFPKDLFPATKTLAANQGLYNGFLAAGLIWSYFIGNVEWQFYVRLFFLGCVAVAGIYGGFTASKKIFFVQALPAIVTVVLMHFVPFCGDSCEKVKKEEVMGTYYYSYMEQHETSKPLNKLTGVRKEWKAFATERFRYNKTNHDITFYKINAPVPDADVFAITLDSLGIIYLESLTWGDYKVLETNNDSINNLVTLALARTLNNAEVKVFLHEFSSKEDKIKLYEIMDEFNKPDNNRKPLVFLSKKK